MKIIVKYKTTLFSVFIAFLLISTSCNGQTTVTFNCTGAAQNWVVPSCVTSINVVVKGAQGGGGSTGGLGAAVTSTLTVTPGQTLQINVGCVGGASSTGFNGGGAGQNASGAGNSSFGGGGASDIRVSPFSLASRIIVAGGGGGTGGGDQDGQGGDGGCSTGVAGLSPFGMGGGAGTQTAGGAGGPPWVSSGNAGAMGVLGNGGAGGSDPCYNLGPGGGGGGGYYGGGGGGSDCFGSAPLGGGGGGGGSSLIPAGGGCTAGTNSGSGVVTITYGIGGAITTASNTGPYCTGQTIQLNSAAGGLTYLWTGPSGYTNSTQNPTRPAATPAMAGTYTVSVTYTGGCTATATTTVIVNSIPVTTVNSPSSCNGAAITLTGAGATSYSWSTGAGTSSVSVSPVTTTSYTVTGTSSGCSSTAVSTVTVISTPTPTPTNSGPVCSGTTLNLFCPAVAGATYNWTGPAGFTSSLQNPTITPVTAANGGNYFVTISIGACTSLQGMTNVVVNNTPSPPVPGSISPLCAGTNIALTASLMAGASYSWAGPAGFSSLVRNPPAFVSTAASSGTYSVTVTVGGCTSLPATVNVVVNPMPVAPTASNDSTCFGTSSTLMASISGPTYEWFNAATGGTLLSTGASFTTPALTTTTTYYVHSTASGCTGPMTAVTVIVTPNFTVNAGLDDSICNGASSNLGVISPTGASYTYTWNPGAISGASVTVAPSVSTTYTVSIIDAIGCSGSDSMTVFVGSPLILNTSNIPATCFGSCNGQVGVTVSGSFPPYAYSWTTGSTDTTAIALCAGTYSITVIDNLGCADTSSATVGQPTSINIIMSSSTSHCGLPDGTVGVVSSGGTGTHTYLWSPGGMTTSSDTTVTPGLYCVSVTDSLGCIDTACITVPSTPGVTATITSYTSTTCNGVCDATANAGVTGGISPYTYHWSNGQTTATATGLCAGPYTCTITDFSGCNDIISVTIIEPAPIIANVPSATVCYNGSTTLVPSVIGGTGPYTYSWSPATGLSSTTASSPTATLTDTTTYTLTVHDANFCTSTGTVIVTVNPALTANVTGTASICPGGSTSLSVTAANGNGTGYTYLWSPAIGLNDPTIANPTATPSATTTYNVLVGDGCSPSITTTSVTITIEPVPVPSFTPGPSGCAPDTVVFMNTSTIASPGTLGTLTWDFGDGGTSVSPAPAHYYENSGTYPVTLTATSASGCTATAYTQNIDIYPVPEAAFTAPLSTSIFAPDIKYTDQSTIDPGGMITSWHWNFGDSLALADSVSSLQNPSHVFSAVGTYCAHLVVKSKPGGCSDYTDLCIIIEPEFTFFIPNAFSPNDDGINEEFFGVGENIKKYDMLIYDRWGKLLFHSDDIKKHWNGKINNTGAEIVKEDVYVYVVKLTDNHDKVHKYIGSVTIVK